MDFNSCFSTLPFCRTFTKTSNNLSVNLAMMTMTVAPNPSFYFSPCSAPPFNFSIRTFQEIKNNQSVTRWLDGNHGENSIFFIILAVPNYWTRSLFHCVIIFVRSLVTMMDPFKCKYKLSLLQLKIFVTLHFYQIKVQLGLIADAFLVYLQFYDYYIRDHIHQSKNYGIFDGDLFPTNSRY